MLPNIATSYLGKWEQIFYVEGILWNEVFHDNSCKKEKGISISTHFQTGIRFSSWSRTLKLLFEQWVPHDMDCQYNPNVQECNQAPRVSWPDSVPVFATEQPRIGISGSSVWQIPIKDLRLYLYRILDQSPTDPRLKLSVEGLGYREALEAPLFGGMPTESGAFLKPTGSVQAIAQRRTHLKKPCATLVWSVERTTNTGPRLMWKRE